MREHLLGDRTLLVLHQNAELVGIPLESVQLLFVMIEFVNWHFNLESDLSRSAIYTN